MIAVTTQRDDIPTKVRSDLAKICTDSAPVDRVIYFTVSPVNVSKRHELQKHARETHSIALDIWDAQAIADELASPDLFYLAVDHLHLPSSLAPERPETEAALPDWYLAGPYILARPDRACRHGRRAGGSARRPAFLRANIEARARPPRLDRRCAGSA